MPRSVVCNYEGDRLGIEEALEIRHRSSSGTLLRFTCVQCGKPLRAHKAGTTGQAAHFEHFERNPACSFSAKAR